GRPVATEKRAAASQAEATGDADRTCVGKISAALARPPLKAVTGRSVRELIAAVIVLVHVVQSPLCRHAARAGHHHAAPAMALPLASVGRFSRCLAVLRRGCRGSALGLGSWLSRCCRAAFAVA